MFKKKKAKQNKVLCHLEKTKGHWLFTDLVGRFHLEKHFLLESHQVKKNYFWRSPCGSVVTNWTSIHEDMGLIPSLPPWLKDLALLRGVAKSCGCRQGSDLALLWLWCWLAAAAPI